MPVTGAIVRPTEASDIDGVVALQRSCFPPPFPEDLLWKPSHIRAHIDQFPEGQFVAIFNETIVASATNMLMTEQNWVAHLSWQDATGGLALPHHDPSGTTLYGIDISVHPEMRGKGIARQLYEARFHLVRTQKYTRYGTVCRMPDYRRSDCPTPEDYAQAVVRREFVDRTLTPLLRLGLTYVGLIPGYLDDPESADTGAILEWNP